MTATKKLLGNGVNNALRPAVSGGRDSFERGCNLGNAHSEPIFQRRQRLPARRTARGHREFPSVRSTSARRQKRVRDDAATTNRRSNVRTGPSILGDANRPDRPRTGTRSAPQGSVTLEQGTKNPTTAQPTPPFPPQTQPYPGRESEMQPRPDYGEQSYKGANRLTGKKALITGGDSGIGRAVALAFAREGADVLISYLNEDDDAEETLRVVRGAGRTAIATPGDIAQEEQCRSLVNRTLKEFGAIDV